MAKDFTGWMKDKTVPPPVKYDLKTMDFGNINGTESGNAALVPLKWEDLASTAADDAVAEFMKMHKGKNPYSVGKQMTDSEYKKFMGITW